MYLLHNRDNYIPIMVMGLKEIKVRALQNKGKACINWARPVPTMALLQPAHEDTSG
jgi:hypothetical protein